jgi:hypothetical protein
MPEDMFSYQVLMDAVFAATDARGSVYLDDSNYMAISLDTVESIVASFDSKPSSSEAENNHTRPEGCGTGSKNIIFLVRVGLCVSRLQFQTIW